MFTSIASIAFLLTTPFNLVKSNRIKLIPSGANILFKVDTKGVVVTGTYQVNANNIKYDPSVNSDIKKGDIILSSNNKSINSIDDLIDTIDDNNQLNLSIKRNGRIENRELKIYYVNDLPRTGLYVKDKVLGVGTLTYIDPKNLIYGSLGHEVIDNDTTKLVEYKSGKVYYNDVVGIKKGVNSHPGEKISNTEMKDEFGNIISINNMGLFGKYNNSIENLKQYEIGYQNEIKKGKATVLTCIKGNNVESFDIEITDLKKQDLNGIKGMTFKITDKELLDISGGVYSGMSGSPIIQNNRIIGAVTHVLVDNIKYGYALYIENMLNTQYSSVY